MFKQTANEALGPQSPWLSIVVPVCNEEGCIRDVYTSIRSVVESMDRTWELIFINDGSGDGSGEILDLIADEDDRVRVIHFRRNFGQTAALRAGFDHVRGEVVVSMDGDGQNDPRDIPGLLAKLDEGFDVATGWRKNRKDSFFMRRLPSLLGNLLIRFFTNVNLRDFGCTLRAYKREVIEELSLYGEMHRMIPVLAHLMGAVIIEVEVNHHPRPSGRSKYNMGRALSVVLDLITLKFFLGYFTRPLHMFGVVGILSFFTGSVSLIAMIFMKISQGVDMTGNPLLVLGVLLLIVGSQAMMMGLLGEVMIRTYFESQKKPTYVIREIREHII